jgi:signal peptidase
MVLRAIVRGLTVGLLGLILLLAIAVIVVPKVTDSVPMTIFTSSMEPTLPPGTLIIVKPKAVNRIAVGDVMTYQIRSGDPTVISHRVVAVNSLSDGTFSFLTKGDNNSEVDPVVLQAKVKGVVWYSVPLFGFVNQAVNTTQRVWIIPALAVGILGYATYMIIRGSIETTQRRKRARQRVAASSARGRHRDRVCPRVIEGNRLPIVAHLDAVVRHPLDQGSHVIRRRHRNVDAAEPERQLSRTGPLRVPGVHRHVVVVAARADEQR